MERIGQSGRTLSRFAETWVRQSERGAGQAPPHVGWYLWAAIAGVTVLFALVEVLHAGA